MVTFHRVGQGLFASEEYGDHTIVYDCGGERIKIVNEAIDFGLPETPDIDILFISHYDQDHINGILHLIETHDIKHVVLPLVSNFSRFLSSRDYIDADFDRIRVLYSNPELFFRNNSPRTHCHFIRDVNENQGGRISISIEDLPKEFDSSIQIILLNGWLLIPYNRKVMTQDDERRFISRLGLDPDLDFDQILEKWPSLDKCIKRKLLETGIVNRYTINDYSMTLYSQNRDSRTLYLGDYNAKDHCDKLQTVYGGFWKEISCVQVPHHGSEKSFNDELLECGANDYVISNTREPTSSKKVDPRPVIDIIKQHKKKPHITDKCKIELKQTPKAT